MVPLISNAIRHHVSRLTITFSLSSSTIHFIGNRVTVANPEISEIEGGGGGDYFDEPSCSVLTLYLKKYLKNDISYYVDKYYV